MSVLFEDIENEIKEKEQFVISQNEKIKSMLESLNEQIEYKVVLDVADKIIHGRLRNSIGHNTSLHSLESERGSHNPFSR